MRYRVRNTSNGRIVLPPPACRSVARNAFFTFDAPPGLLERPFGINSRVNIWQNLIDSGLIGLSSEEDASESTSLQSISSGIAGAAAAVGFLYQQDLSSQVTGSNNDFTTTFPFVAGTLEAYVDGVNQTALGEVTEDTPSTGSFSFSSNPTLNSKVWVRYGKA